VRAGGPCPGAGQLWHGATSASRARLALLVQKSLLLVLVYTIEGKGGERKFADDTELCR